MILSATFTANPDPLISSTGFIVALIVSVLLVVVIIAALVRMHTKAQISSQQSTLPPAQPADTWKKRVESVQSAYAQGAISADEAFHELSLIARQFASQHLGKDITKYTLADLKFEQRTARNASGIDMLRQTIEALYPPEFADAAKNTQARNTTVDQACSWVITLIMRWSK